MKTCLLVLIVLLPILTYAQDITFVENDTTLTKHSRVEEDLGGYFRRIRHKPVDTAKANKSPKVAILPSFGYNPSLGAIIGAKVSGVKQLGDPKDTHLSAFGLEFLLTSKGVITVQARHNIFRAANKWNIQGNWQFSKFLVADYGIGTGNNYLTGGDSVFTIKFNYIRLTQGAYRRIAKDLYAGGGIAINIRTKIDDERLEDLSSTPHQRYSERHNIDPAQYSCNGLLAGIQYDTRDHPLRSYSGAHIEIVLRYNPEWLGSAKNSTQFYYDIRKYIGLSKRNPAHVLAFWSTASFRLSGAIPYLELPSTGSDLYNRSGRAYTISRFKGPSFAYGESEYRFPITPNKLLSGVAFINVQTASDDLGKNIFQYWEPGVGAGLRVLLQKKSRTVICVDYAVGKHDSSGIFFGLNEAF
ncbi:MAG TPA: BamA/TamA family outer membrane protein [Chryseolinea sp.]|nr:BamA/TamA family outer membrane protein [Chryseolinea sp.]